MRPRRRPGHPDRGGRLDAAIDIGARWRPWPRCAATVVPLVTAPAAGPTRRTSPRATASRWSGWRWISTRTLEVDITTAKVAADRGERPAPGAHHACPNDYFQSVTTRYPVLYLLHGGAGGNSAQWTTGGGAVEQITDGKPLITVMPDGGQGRLVHELGRPVAGRAGLGGLPRRPAHPVGRRQPAHDPDQGRPRHRRPVDGRLRRRPLRPGPARPVRLRRPASRAPSTSATPARARSSPSRPCRTASAPTARSATRSGPSTAPGTRSTRSAGPPGCKACRWRSTPAAGATTRTSSRARCGRRPTASTPPSTPPACPNFYWMYGRPGPSAPFGCDGGHNFGCWNFALARRPAPDARRAPGSGHARRRPPPSDPVVDGGFEDAGPRPVGLHRQLRRRPRRRPGPHRHRRRLGPQHLGLERRPPDDRGARRTTPTRSPRGCGRRPTTPTATSACAPSVRPGAGRAEVHPVRRLHEAHGRR